ncbi:DNA-binding response regulator [Clostridium autoethanogenum]|uniref:DNA-binding response regulator n=1 Tax=Clostridium autoethanogenum TaxID=84023 RepID=A0A3M0T4K9_9CLOT|nr:DNA-binding response regulator [Clostridium autoethanogenum]RMD04922.1 DNA-binding response regulator [Clostridium autoethanogenum]
MKAILDKQQVKKLYLDGLTVSEIAKKLSSKNDTVKKCIERNFSDLKHEHDVVAIRRKEVLKATNYEAKKYMGDSTFVRKNRSIYKTNPDGDIVVNKKIAPIITWDTPQRLVNENKVKY